MASGITASGVNSMILGREVAKTRELEQLSGYLTKNEFSQKLARARTGIEGLEPSELKNSLVAALNAADAELLALPDPNFDNAVKFVTDVIKTAQQVVASA